jgi:hypothetical protein
MGPKFLMARTAGHPRPDGRHEAPRTHRQHGEEVNVVGTAAAPFLVSWDVPVRPVGTGPFPCLSWPILNPRVTHFVQIGTVLICRNDSPLTFCHGAYKRATGSVTRTKAEEYRRLAQECLAMARTVSTEEARADLMTMAQVWHRLANEQDQRSDLAETPAPPPATEQTQPVVQQQQQVQPKDDAKKE